MLTSLSSVFSLRRSSNILVRKNSICRAIRSGIVGTLSLIALQQHGLLGQSADVKFVPRESGESIRDLEDLRLVLSQLKDSKGAIDPLADYVKPKNAVRREKNREVDRDEAEQSEKNKPILSGSEGENYKTPTIELESVEDLTWDSPLRPNHLLHSREGESRTGRNAPSNRDLALLQDDFRPVSLQEDRAAAVRPRLSDDVRYSSPTIAMGTVWNDVARERFARFQEVPFGSPGTPTIPFPSGNNAVLPTYPPNYPAQNNIPNPNILNPSIVNPSIMPTTPAGSPAGNMVLPNGGATQPPPGVPGVFSNDGLANTQPTLSNQPSYVTPPTYVPSSPSNVGSIAAPIVMPAPQPGYLTYPGGAVGGVNPLATAPNGYAQPPRYTNAGGIINNQPFVNGPPEEIDARFMYRQDLGDCNSCGPRPYAGSPSGSIPFSYTPPTYFPGAFNGYDTSHGPLIGFGQDLRQAQLGRGIFGQPKAYMQSQPVRNFIRYLFP